MKTRSKRWPYVACVVLQTVIFGSGNAITKMAYESITPMWCLAIRFGLAALVFAIFFGPRIVRQLKGARIGAWMPAALCMALAYLTCNVALDLTTATNVGFLVALPVVFAPLLSCLVNRRRYPLAFLPFQAAVGLYLLCSNGGAPSFGLGEILALLSSVALAGALVFGERGLEQLDATTVAGTQIVASFVVALACALVFEPPVNVAAVQPVAWGTIAFLALLSTCLTFMLQNVALTELPSSTVSLLLTGEPVFTAAFSFMLLGEALSAAGMAGAVVIVASVVAATWVEGRQSAPAASPAPQAEHALALEEGWFEGAEFGAQSSLAGVELPHLAPSERRSFASERAASSVFSACGSPVRILNGERTVSARRIVSAVCERSFRETLLSSGHV